jgi:hypothetical protein
VIIFQIDNLHYEAAKRLQLTNVLALAAQGTSVDEAYVPIPWHQTTGDYGKVHTTSLPNPVTFAGTMFLAQGQHAGLRADKCPASCTSCRDTISVAAPLSRRFEIVAPAYVAPARP